MRSNRLFGPNIDKLAHRDDPIHGDFAHFVACPGAQVSEGPTLMTTSPFCMQVQDAVSLLPTLPAGFFVAMVTNRFQSGV